MTGYAWLKKFICISSTFAEAHSGSYQISVELYDGAFPVNQLTTSAPHHRETSQLICNANELTGFYIMGHIGY